MRGVFGRRTGVEAVFLVAVPVIVLTAGQSPSVIIASAGLAYLLVLLFEIWIWRTRPEARAAAAMPAPAAEPPETVRVLPHAGAEAVAAPADSVRTAEPGAPPAEPAPTPP